MKAELILKDKIAYDGGFIQEMIIWKVPVPVEGSKHNYKYRLFYGLPGTRIIGYDNERPKGDHRHYDDQEENYTFSTVQQLVNDFLNDVECHLEKPNE